MDKLIEAAGAASYPWMDFPLSRYKHCHSVGLKMMDYAKRVYGWEDSLCKEMFILGCIHDIGYEIDPDAFGHDYALADVLGPTFKYSNEVRYHSKLQNEYDSFPMRLLYFGDSTVDGFGNWCTFDERLADIESRYGKDSEVWKETNEIIQYLINLGFNDKCQLK